jgi:Trm5-related predicted tRNA methylase
VLIFNNHLKEEQERRQLFDEEIEVMKFEFEQYLKEQYPEFDKSNIANKEVVVDPPSPEELQSKRRRKTKIERRT